MLPSVLKVDGAMRALHDTEKSHFAANRDDCNGMGQRETLLGYDLKQ
jgi:hypothetical protein